MKNTFLVALRAIMVNKGRAFLTMLGVIIGVSSVVMLTSIGNGLQSYITDQFESLGSNNIFIAPGKLFNSEGGFSDRSEQSSSLANNKLKMSDVAEIRKLREFVSYVSLSNTQTDRVQFQKKEKDVTVFGTTEDYDQIFSTKLIRGRFLEKKDQQGAEKVAVLGFTVAEDTFGKIDPVGKRVKIGTQTFLVIGVAEKKGGGFGGPSFDEFVYIPFSTMSQIYDSNNVLSIYVKAKNKDQIPQSIAAIKRVLLKRMDEDEFSVVDQSEILKTINGILGMLTIGLGGIGIMNIMLVSVTERTREIGLRKALGATPSQILFQFLIEAALLSVIGGLIGLGIAYLGTLAIQSVFPAKITIEAVILSFGVSTLVGLVFGAAPANRAAHLSPIEALRYE